MSTTLLHTTLTSTSGSTELHSFGLAPIAATIVSQQRSMWQSPMTYLFGGLAAMLGLIAFALLILACSYLKLAREQQIRQRNQDLEKGVEIGKLKSCPVYEEKIVVIMAGNEVPTFLANPVQIFPSNQHLSVVGSVSKIGGEDESSATTASSFDDDKSKEVENDEHHN